MGYYKVDPEKMKQLAEDAKPSEGGGGNFGEWLKLHTKENVLRVAPPWSEEGSPFRKLLSHNGPFRSPFMTAEGKRVAPLCLRYLFATDQQHLADIALDAGKITADDEKLVKEYGCPMCQLPITLKADKKDKEAANHWARTQYIWNVVNREDGKLYKYSCSKKIATPIEAMFKMYPQVFDPVEGRDMTVVATGENETRRYDPPVFAPFNSPLEYEGELNDLDDVMLIGVRGFDEVLALAINNNTTVPIETRLSSGMIDYAEAKGLI